MTNVSGLGFLQRPGTNAAFIRRLIRPAFRLFADEDRDRAPAIIILFWAAALFVLTNPFTFILMGEDPTAKVMRNSLTMRRSEGSQTVFYLIRFIVPLSGLGVIMLQRKYRNLRRSLSALWPVMPFALWAALTTLWSDSPDATMHGILALWPLFFSAGLMVASLGPVKTAKAVLITGIIIAASSTLTAMLLPHYGVHQQTDASQSVHAGLWRGVYIHKNQLGQISAMLGAATLLSGRLLRPAILRWAVFALWMMLIAKAGSASSLVILPITVILVMVLIIFDPMRRAFALLIAPVIAIVSSLLLGLLLQMLGRDMTLTGRTTIWEIAFEAIVAHPFEGFGFMSSTYGSFVYELRRRAYVIDPHNMYLDFVLGTGGIGLVLFLIAALTGMAVASALHARSQSMRPAAIVFGCILAGWLTSGLSESNDRPLGGMATLGYVSIGLLLACRPYLSDLKRQRLAIGVYKDDVPVIIQGG